MYLFLSLSPPAIVCPSRPIVNFSTPTPAPSLVDGNYSYDTTVEYLCYQGYRAEFGYESINMTCGGIGEWTNDYQTCDGEKELY